MVCCYDTIQVLCLATWYVYIFCYHTNNNNGNQQVCRSAATTMSSTSSAATAPRWADLPANVCDLVREHLDPITLLRFPAVCRHWFEACEESPLLPLGVPALLTSGLDPDGYEIEYDVEVGTFGLHDVSAGGGGRKSFLGKAEGLKGRTWVGGNHGWLTTINKGCDVELLNPLTGAWVRLPSFATISRVKVVGDLRVCTPSAYIFNNTHKILKVALCRTPAHAGYLAVVIFSNGLLAFTAAGGGGEGECRWTAVKNPATDASYMDAIVLDGKLFAVNEIGHVYSWDLDGGAMTEPAVFRDQRLISVANMTMTGAGSTWPLPVATISGFCSSPYMAMESKICTTTGECTPGTVACGAEWCLTIGEASTTSSCRSTSSTLAAAGGGVSQTLGEIALFFCGRAIPSSSPCGGIGVVPILRRTASTSLTRPTATTWPSLT